MHARILTAAAIGLTLACAPPALGQDFKPDPVDIAAAKKEGMVSWYTSTPVQLAQALASKFQEDTGIRVQLLRTGGTAVLRRIMSEIKAGQAGADILTFSDAAAADDMARQGLFAAFTPAGFDKIRDDVKDKDGRWIAQRIQVLGMPVRTDKVAEKDRPRTWSDLKDAKYKGKMVMPDPNFTAIQVIVVSMLSRKLGWDFYKALRANDTMIVQGHQQVFQTLQQGERVLGAEGAPPRTYNKGQVVPNHTLIFPSEGAFFVCSPMAILKGAAHPNAARAFARFMFSTEAQSMIAASGIHASRADIAPPPGEPALSAIKSWPIDYDYVHQQTRSTKTRFSEIFQ
ncbi:MAG: extracellular solute-binding protein [Rhizobiales bacterium]|nr:extracellular solute-binding protein [Hyphomicrobiales bacterium]